MSEITVIIIFSTRIPSDAIVWHKKIRVKNYNFKFCHADVKSFKNNCKAIINKKELIILLTIKMITNKNNQSLSYMVLKVQGTKTKLDSHKNGK